MVIPCKECLVRATCRHKTFMQINVTCRPIWNLLYFIRDGGFGITRKENFDERIKEIISILKPTKWGITWGRGPNGYHIVVVEGSYEYHNTELRKKYANDTM